MKKIILLFVCLSILWVTNANAQFNVSAYFSDFGQKVGVGYVLKERINFDLSFYAVEHLDDFTPEFTVTVNILKKESYNLYIGTGFIANSYSAVTFPIGVQVKPFNAIPKLKIKFELTPMVGLDGDPDRFVPGFGISYSLGK